MITPFLSDNQMADHGQQVEKPPVQADEQRENPGAARVGARRGDHRLRLFAEAVVIQRLQNDPSNLLVAGRAGVNAVLRKVFVGIRQRLCRIRNKNACRMRL